MSKQSYAELEAVAEPVFSWKAAQTSTDELRNVRSIAFRLAYVVTEPDLDSDTGSIKYENGAAVINGSFGLAGIPIRNQINKFEMEWGDNPFMMVLRSTDAFGDVLIEIDPAKGKAVAYSVTIDRILKGGISYHSPRPEEQMITRIGRFTFDPVGVGKHQLILKSVEEQVSLSIDGNEVVAFEDPDVAAGCFGIGTWETIKLFSVDQKELITAEESKWRGDFVHKMNEFCADLDKERDADIAERNSLVIEGDTLTWKYPETGAILDLKASEGLLTGEAFAGLHGNARLFTGVWAYPEVTDVQGEVYHPAKDKKATLEGDGVHFTVRIPLRSESGNKGTANVLAKFTENATWFCTASVEGIVVKHIALAFGLDKDFKPNMSSTMVATQAAVMAYGTDTLVTDGGIDPSREGFGLGVADGKELSPSLLYTNAQVGHVWKALSSQDTKMMVKVIGGQPAVILHSDQQEFRWGYMWLPYHKMNLTGFKKRMLHFIRYPDTPNSEWREQPSICEYPTNEELERFAAGGVKAMVWHHTWASNNNRYRKGFVINEKEMQRAMKKTHELGMETIPYIGIVPGRHPILRYEDLGAVHYDKNWDLQDFTFYAVGGRYAEFFPYMTDQWCKEYGIDGFYSDGGLAGGGSGRTGLSEKDFGGLSTEELNDRFYARVRKVLKRNGARFGLENWGAAGIHMAGPWYDCRMIGEAFQEAAPETYRDAFNSLVTGTPFKMYGMDLTARNRYNVAMSAVCMTDIQLCSGNYAWGNWPDRPSDWKNIAPWWAILQSIDWDNLTDAQPWWTQELVNGENIFAGYYFTPGRALVFLANRAEDKRHMSVQIQIDKLPEDLRKGKIRPIYPETEEWFSLGDGTIEIDLPRLHDGPLGFEIVK